MDGFYEPKIGDWGVTQIEGPVGEAIRIGQWLIGCGYGNYQHAFVYIGPYGMNKRCIVEAEPGGARIANLSIYEGALFGENPKFDIKFFKTPPEYADFVADRAIELVGTPYSFLDYAAIAAHRFHLSNAASLKAYVASTKHMICSQLVDEACLRAGLHLFDDGRWPGYVTPMDLYKLIAAQDLASLPNQEQLRGVLQAQASGLTNGWPVTCPYCGQVVDSRDSYADSKADLRDHVALKHPGKPIPE